MRPGGVAVRTGPDPATAIIDVGATSGAVAPAPNGRVFMVTRPASTGSRLRPVSRAVKPIAITGGVRRLGDGRQVG